VVNETQPAGRPGGDGPGGGRFGGDGGGSGGGRFGGEGGGPRGPRPGGAGGPRGRRRFGGGRLAPRRKICAFCADNIDYIDYKDSSRLRRYVTERAKIEARRKYGTCAKHQRGLAVAIKRARHMALLPFTSQQTRG
jgi:small subunit ribosomal protein S18